MALQFGQWFVPICQIPKQNIAGMIARCGIQQQWILSFKCGWMKALKDK